MNITFKYFRPKKFTGLTAIKYKKPKGWATEFYYCHPIASDDGRIALDRLTGEELSVNAQQFTDMIKETQEVIESISHLERGEYIRKIKEKISERRAKHNNLNAKEGNGCINQSRLTP